jgi:CMP-N,N'-diacetyllegionaminic acid synthase
VPFMRPSEFAHDEATAEDVVIHALDWMARETGTRPKSVMFLQPTSPFRPPNLILEAVKLLEDTLIDGVIGVKPIHRSLATLFHADNAMNMTALGKDEKRQSRRQDVKTIYTPNGAMYLIRTEKLLEPVNLFPQKMQGIVMDQIASIDIDDPIDWKMAEAMVANKQTWRNGNN